MTGSIAFLVLLAAVMHASWNAALRSGQDRLWAGSAMSCFSASCCALAILFLPMPAPESWSFIAISAVVHVVYSLLLVRMYQQGHFGVTYPVARGSSPLLITLGAAVLGVEFVSAIHMTGILLVSVSIFILGTSREHLHRESIPPALATGAAIATYSLIDGLGVRRSGNALSYTAWMMLLQGVGMALVFVALRVGQAKGLFTGRSRADLAQAVGAGVISVTAYGIVIWAMQRSPMGMVSALRETSVLFAAILGRVFLRESFNARKLIAAGLIALGAVCLH